MRLLAPIAAVLLGAGVSIAISQGTPTDSAADPIAYVGHGAVFGANGRQVPVTAAFLRAAQDHYIARVGARATAAQAAAFAGRAQYIRDLTASDPKAELQARNRLLDAFLTQVAPPDAVILRQRTGVLRALLARPEFQPEGGTAGRLPVHLEAQLAQVGLPAPAAAPPFALLQAREAYMKKCAQAGVPIPPGWDQAAAKKWTRKGTLAKPFIETSFDAGLYVYQSAKPLGVCMALTRFTNNVQSLDYGFYPLLGVICMGAEPKNDSNGDARVDACFWDAPDRVKIGDALPLSEFLSGPEFDGSKGICTDCHGGENAFIVHPDDPAFKNNIQNLRPKAWYRPIGLPGLLELWPLNAVPTVDILANEASAGKCNDAGCHKRNSSGGAFPQLSTLMPGYCNTMIKTAYAETMPPLISGDPVADPRYQAHVTKLLTACRNDP